MSIMKTCRLNHRHHLLRDPEAPWEAKWGPPELRTCAEQRSAYRLCSRLENTDQPSDIVLNPLNELERRNKLQVNRNYVYVQQQCQTFVTAAKKDWDDEAALYSLAQSFQKKMDSSPTYPYWTSCSMRVHLSETGF